MKESGTGFGAPIVLRYLLEFFETTHEAAEVLRHIPFHMAYNVLIVDKFGNFVTAFTRPDGPTLIRRTPASTNHQDRVAWPRHAEATGTLERERRLFELLADRKNTCRDFQDAFTLPPLYQTKFDRGFGTLYTAAYRPRTLEATYSWPGKSLRLSPSQFIEERFRVSVGS